MIDLQDIEMIEGDTTCTEIQYYEAIQRAINSGMWGLQGSYGRTMMEADLVNFCNAIGMTGEVFLNVEFQKTRSALPGRPVPGLMALGFLQGFRRDSTPEGRSAPNG